MRLPRFEEPPLAPDASFAELVYDEPFGRFRSASEARIWHKDVNVHGFAELRMSGSSQFGASEFAEVMRRVRNSHAGHVVDADLRQESHGFLFPHAAGQSGVPVCWFAEEDWGLSGIPDQESLSLESLRILILRRSPAAWVGRKGRTGKETVQVREAMDESEMVSVHSDVSYWRMLVTDHCRPRDSVVDEFVPRALSGHAQGWWHHFHCRGGAGRTTVFMVMLDMLVNARDVPFDDVLERNSVLSGYDPTVLPPPSDPRRPYAKDRIGFLKAFYQYAKDRASSRVPPSWSDWVGLP